MERKIPKVKKEKKLKPNREEYDANCILFCFKIACVFNKKVVI